MRYLQLDIFGGSTPTSGLPRRERENGPMRYFFGQIDDSINYCPHCGKRLQSVSVERSTDCQKCGKTFLVIEDLNDKRKKLEISA